VVQSVRHGFSGHGAQESVAKWQRKYFTDIQIHRQIGVQIKDGLRFGEELRQLEPEVHGTIPMQRIEIIEFRKIRLVELERADAPRGHHRLSKPLLVGLIDARKKEVENDFVPLPQSPGQGGHGAMQPGQKRVAAAERNVEVVQPANPIRAGKEVSMTCASSPYGIFPRDGMTWKQAARAVTFWSMSVSRGAFLKALGKSLPGMVLGSGAATAAYKLFSKMAAVSDAPDEVKSPSTTPRQEAPPAAKIEFIKSGSPEGNRIALTFDDGPTPGVTERILDALEQRQLHATFFMIGQKISATPDLARRVLAEGHEIGNHTFTHPKLTDLPPAQVETEIQKSVDVMHDVLGYRAAWFRAPYDALRQNQAPVVAQKGLGVVAWSVNPNDWAQPGEEKIIAIILAETKPGSIIVCHDLHAQTANALDRILDGLLERGLQFVALSPLMRPHDIII
jgi:peptidoglycan-N-acetylglucosamine deacetylase